MSNITTSDVNLLHHSNLYNEKHFYVRITFVESISDFRCERRSYIE